MMLSLIIPCLNAAHTIGLQLDALLRQRWSKPWEIIVSDNGSSDDTRSIVKSYQTRFSNIQLVDSSGRKGSAHARNVGVAASSGEMLVFCDTDDEVGPGWLEAIGTALERHDFVASCLETKKLNPPWCQFPHTQSKSLQKAWYSPYLPHAAGAGLGIKRQIHDKVGGFDESLLRLADTDYCFRVQLLGVKLHFVPNAVYHYRRPYAKIHLFNQARLWSESNVLLSVRFGHVMETPKIFRPHVRFFVRRCWKFVLTLSKVYQKQGRYRAIKQLGSLVGFMHGQIKYRFLSFS